MHVAGTVAGNTQGWARHANIYNLNPYSTGNTQNSSYYGQKYDYIRAFHKFKPINPATGVKNPTIVNGSFGSSYLVSLTNMSVNFRGNTVTTNAASESYAQLRDWGLNGTIENNQIPKNSNCKIKDKAALAITVHRFDSKLRCTLHIAYDRNSRLGIRTMF